MKTVLYVEEYFHDFEIYSKLLTDNGFRVYPSLDEIKNQEGLYKFLHNHTTDYNQLKENVFKYIIEKELYKEVTLLILDINIFGKKNDGKQDESGCQLLSDFRNNFYSFAQKHNIDNDDDKNWGKRLIAIALTIYDKSKREEFMKRHGYFRETISKKEVKNNPNAFIQKLINWEEEKAQTPSKQNSNVIINKNININENTGNNSPIIIGNNNDVLSHNIKENKLVEELGKKGITEEQANELIKILKEEKQDEENQILGPKARKWCENIKTVALNILSNLIFQIMYNLPKI